MKRVQFLLSSLASPVVATLLMAGAQPAAAELVVNQLGNRGDGHTVVQISYDGSGANTGTWTVPAGVTEVEVLVIGGGGAGGRGGAFGSAGGTGGSPGGGAGGLYSTTSYAVTPGSSIDVRVGAGGPTTTATGNGADGGDSAFGLIIAYGGQGGQYTINQGGNQGGYSLDGGSNVTPGFLGGTGAGAVGGAGAGENGQAGGYRPSYGGAGVAVPITGVFGVVDASGSPIPGFYGNMAGYGGGGSAGYDGHELGTTHGEAYGGGSGSEPENNAGLPGCDTLGGGGGGGRGANGGAGGDGVVIVAYIVEGSKTPTTLELVSSANPSIEGNAVQFTAKVKVGDVTATGATGTCEFHVDSLLVDTVAVTDGVASYSASGLLLGPHAIEAVYSGDAAYQGSSNSLSQSVVQPLASTTFPNRGDGFTVVMFTGGAGNWTVPAGVSSLEVLVIGGGGAGGRGGAFGSAGGTGGSPGGGAGGLYYTTSWTVTPGGSVNVAIGTGAPATTATGNGADGGHSVFGSIIAYGGQGGQYTINQGGNQGGFSIDGGLNVTPGFLGGTGAGAVGGAGAGENGQIGGYRPSYGGTGVAVPITGTLGVVDAGGNPISGFYGNMTGYAGGGSAGYDGHELGATHGESCGGGSGSEPENTAGIPGYDLTGGGGGGGRSANGGGGGSGVVIVAYQAGGKTPYQVWDDLYAADLSDPNGDHDGDGVSNHDEFAFGLDPTSAFSVNPLTDLGGLKGGSFRYTRYAASGLTYTVWTSTDLKTWAEETALTQEEAGPPVGGVQTWLVTFDSPPATDKLFVRVRAAE